MTETIEERDAFYNSILTAKFVSAQDDGFLFDIGDETPALVEKDEFDDAHTFEPGAEVRLLVERPYGEYWAASIRKAEKLAVWEWLEQLAASGEAVEGTVVAENKGGLSVDVGGVRAFVPRSQIDIHRVDDCSPYVGRTAKFRVIKFDRKRGNVVASRRALLEEQREEDREDLVESLEAGQIYEGVVRNVVPYGAFVDIGGIEGLLHKSNLSWGRVDHPSELVRPGDSVRVVVLDYDRKRERLSLGRKQLLSDPWEDIASRYQENEVVEGKVVSLADFGAFVEVQPGLEGLVHVTELSWTERINHPKEVLELGAEIGVKIVGIDVENRRLSLSIKQLEQNPWETAADEMPPGTRVRGTITNITDFGLFVQIAPAIEGLVHVSDLSWTQKIEDPAAHYQVGEELEVVVLDIDAESTRASLGIKQLSEDPWERVAQIAKPGERIEVTISRIVDFGAFAEIADGIEGLIHISELSPERVERVTDVVRPGQQVKVLVTSFDRANQRIGLSIKREELGEEFGEAREYIDSGGATATLGDILRDRLGLASSDETQDAPEAGDEASASAASDDAPVEDDAPAEIESVPTADDASTDEEE